MVVTIVVLLILAGITITYVIGDNSIIKKAQEAKNKTEDAMQNEQNEIRDLANLLKNETGGGTTNPPSSKVEISTITQKVDKNTPAEDSFGNPITVPEGFKVVPDGQDGVEYNYIGDKKPTVQDGIVIEDEEGNQFVWIPVGKIKNKDGSSTTIQLARYIFDITIDPDSYIVSGGTGAVKQTIADGSGLSDAWLEVIGREYEYLEEASTSSTYGNIKSKDIEDFKAKSKANGGYYLARYEASYKDSTHCYSKQSTSTRTDTNTALTSGMLWNYITQPDAATIARNMYTSTNFQSDLINSYAWDTAIVFIQAYSEDNDYSKENGPTFSSTLKNTGVTTDKKCNIYDIASNTLEWTTETCTYTDSPCTFRGGVYENSRGYSAHRGFNYPSASHVFLSFRPLLYVR